MKKANCAVCGNEFEKIGKIIVCSDKCRRERWKLTMARAVERYRQTAKGKATIRAREQKYREQRASERPPKVILPPYHTRPEVKARKAAYHREYRNRPEFQAWRAAYLARADIKRKHRLQKRAIRKTPAYQEWRREYEARPEVKARRAARRTDAILKLTEDER